jgi:hypothetical protein
MRVADYCGLILAAGGAIPVLTFCAVIGDNLDSVEK